MFVFCELYTSIQGSAGPLKLSRVSTGPGTFEENPKQTLVIYLRAGLREKRKTKPTPLHKPKPLPKPNTLSPPDVTLHEPKSTSCSRNPPPPPRPKTKTCFLITCGDQWGGSEANSRTAKPCSAKVTARAGSAAEAACSHWTLSASAAHPSASTTCLGFRV